ncbi:MAG: ThiF family adenylyltransferase [Clostridia bacterium]
METDQNQRTKLLLSKEKFDILQNSSICIVGVGGVGGFSAEMLTRAGVGSLTIVDFDIISTTNINRQIIALNSNVGYFKVDEFRKRLLDINPNLQLNTICEKLTEENIEQIISKDFDFVVDAIDDVKNKVKLIKFCQDKSIRIVSALGAGNKLGIPEFKVTDIFKTENDGLAKKMRKELRDVCIEHLDVVYSNLKSEKVAGCDIGSISFYPAMCGCVISAHVVCKLLE